MRTLHIDWADLEIAFRDAGTESYLDKESGEVLSIVDGFDDERDLRERLARFPGRFIRIVPVDKEFSRGVVERFIARQKKGASQRKLAEAFDGPGGLSRVMAVLRDDKAAMGSYARFEQSELLRVIEDFLRAEGVGSDSPSPALELFEGLA